MVENPEVPNVIVAGKYRLSRLLGRGGMGSVWEGVHATLGTRVAVKFIESEYADSAEARSRFENEARAAATLRSKHVVEVYDHGVAPDGRPFIVMEYLEGEPLDRRLDRLGRMAPKDTARILHQVCRALSKAHAAGIVHRDLKPENIFLVWDDEDAADIAKVVDFGIAKFTDQALSPSSATRTGSVLGTPYYMSPEQARGLRSVDQRSDLWSVGVIAFRCIVGNLPFEGEGIGDLLVKLCTEPIPVPSQRAPDVPSGFDAFVARALAREPERRFQSAQELSESLGAVCGLSVRGGYAAVDMGAVSGTGPRPALSLSVPLPHAQGVTGAPLTQTPAPSAGRRSGSGAMFAIVAIALVALSAGAGIVVKVLAKNDPTEAETLLGSVSLPAPTLVAPPPPAVAPVEPAERTAAVAPLAGSPEVAAQPAASATPRPLAPSAQRQRAPGRVAPRAPAPKAEPVPPPPAPVAEPVPRPTPPKKPPASREIDIGY